MLKSFEVQSQQQSPSPFRSFDSGIVTGVLCNDGEVHRIFCFRSQGPMLARALRSGARGNMGVFSGI